jgi:hypothetical protein
MKTYPGFMLGLQTGSGCGGEKRKNLKIPSLLLLGIEAHEMLQYL